SIQLVRKAVSGQLSTPVPTKDQLLRGFRRRSIFVSCNTVGALLISEKIFELEENRYVGAGADKERSETRRNQSFDNLHRRSRRGYLSLSFRERSPWRLNGRGVRSWISFST